VPAARAPLLSLSAKGQIGGHRRGPRRLVSPLTSIVYPTLDAYIDAQAPLNNYGADSWLYFGVSFLGGTKLYRWRSIINFDLSGLIGRTLTDASLTAYSQIGAGGSVPATFYRLTPPGTVTEYGVTWNKYDGVNNWLAPGGDWHPTLPTPLPYTFTGSPGTVVIPGFLPFCQDAIDNRAGALRFMLKANNEGQVNIFAAIASRQNVTPPAHFPYLTIVSAAP